MSTQLRDPAAILTARRLSFHKKLNGSQSRAPSFFEDRTPIFKLVSNTDRTSSYQTLTEQARIKH